jgi:iron complex transport system substrate-binding protein
VVGVTTVDTYPPEVATMPKVGGFVPKSLSIETIVSLKPDLVLAAGELQRPTIEALECLGLTVVAIEDPSSFDEVYADTTLRPSNRRPGPCRMPRRRSCALCWCGGASSSRW